MYIDKHTISLGFCSVLLQNIFVKFGGGLSGSTRTISTATEFYKNV